MLFEDQKGQLRAYERLLSKFFYTVCIFIAAGWRLRKNYFCPGKGIPKFKQLVIREKTGFL
jgi:hypothetical protein